MQLKSNESMDLKEPLKDSSITPKHTPGFAQRLTRVLQHAQVREYGRLTLLARETGLTAGGARLMFTEDRPPKHLTVFKLLVSALCRFLKGIGQEVDPHALSKHLLDGSEDPLNLESTKEFEDILGSVDAVYVAKIYVLIDNIASSINVDLHRDIETNKLRDVYNRVVRYCVDGDVNTESEELGELVVSLIKLAKAKML